jgi:hypothetical protein
VGWKRENCGLNISRLITCRQAGRQAGRQEEEQGGRQAEPGGRRFGLVSNLVLDWQAGGRAGNLR